MQTYIALIKFTDSGAKAVRESPSRANDTYERAKKYGGKVAGLYLTLGEYDVVHIFEFPNDEAMVQFQWDSESLGNVRMNILRAFPETDYRRLLETLK